MIDQTLELPCGWLSLIKDIANVIFFIGVPSIALIAYLQAKKSLFTPHKTEVFKRQLDILDNTAAYFMFYDEYMLIDKLKLITIGENTLAVHLALTDAGVSKTAKPNFNGLCLIETWHSKRVGQGCVSKLVGNNLTEIYEIFFSAQFIAEKEAIRKITSSHLLPTDIKDCAREFYDELDSTYQLIIDGINEALSTGNLESENSTPYLQRTKRLNYCWKNKLVNSKEVTRLMDTSEEIQFKIKNYYKVDKIWS